MTDTIRIRRRTTGSPGAPAALAAAELAFNEVDNTLWYGKGNSGGAATSVLSIGGPGAFAPLASPALTGTPTAPTAAPGTNSTQVATTAFVVAAVPGPAVTAPLMDGSAVVGTSTLYARQDHVHPTDTSRAPIASPTFTGVPAAPTATAGTNTTQVATTAFVTAAVPGPSAATPLMDGAAAVGSSALYSRGDHVHPTDTSRAPLASPTFTGTPAAPTAAPGANTTQLATTAFVAAGIAAAPYAPLASPALTGTPTAPTATAGTSSTQLATTAFVAAAVPGPATVAPLMNGAAAVGTSALYARQDHVHPSDTSLLPLAGGTMTGPIVLAADPAVPLQAATKQYVDAAAGGGGGGSSFSTGTFAGMQVNGGFDISQLSAFTLVANINGYICDCWQILKSGSVVLSGQVLNNLAFLPGIPCYLTVNTTTAVTTLGSTDLAAVVQLIEGYRVQRLAFGTAGATAVTIGFWSIHSLAGIYSVALRNNTYTRSCAMTYTHNTANVAQYNTITFPGDTTAGQWYGTTNIGLNITFAIAAGASNIAPSVGTWQAGNYVAAPGQVNAVAATSNVFRITGFNVFAGNAGPSAAQSPLVMRPYDYELGLCQRYFELLQGFMGNGYATATTTANIAIKWANLKRVVPTVTPFGYGSNWFVNANTLTNLAAATNITLNGCVLPVTVGSGLTANQGAYLYNTTTAVGNGIQISAQL